MPYNANNHFEKDLTAELIVLMVAIMSPSSFLLSTQHIESLACLSSPLSRTLPIGPTNPQSHLPCFLSIWYLAVTAHPISGISSCPRAGTPCLSTIFYFDSVCEMLCSIVSCALRDKKHPYILVYSDLAS